MLTTLKNWKLTSYTNNTWTDVVSEQATLSTIIISNTTGSAINVSARVYGITTCVFLSNTSIPANSSQILDVKGVNIVSGETMQINASAAGINVLVSGAI